MCLCGAVSDDAALIHLPAERAGYKHFCQRPDVLPGGGCYAGVFAGKTAGDAKATLHPAHRGHCADARHERSVCVPAAGGLAEYCKLCHHYRVGAGLDLPADREKDKARRLRSAPARQIPDGVCHLCLLPRRQNRHGLSFRGAAGRRRLGGVPDLLAIVCAVAHGTGAGAKLFLILPAVFWRGIRLALLSDASPAKPLRRTARRTGRRCAVGPVASAAESFLLQSRYITAEHCRTACCLCDARCIFHLCV